MQGDFLKEEYRGSCGDSIEFIGLSFKDNGFKGYLHSKVKPKFDDIEWTDMLVKESVELTGFSADNLVEVFKNREMVNE